MNFTLQKWKSLGSSTQQYVYGDPNALVPPLFLPRPHSRAIQIKTLGCEARNGLAEQLCFCWVAADLSHTEAGASDRVSKVYPSPADAHPVQLAPSTTPLPRYCEPDAVLCRS
jgi:hypothetical protein